MAEFEVGERVRVLPGARSNTDSYDIYEEIATPESVMLLRGLDEDNDYGVRDEDSNLWYIAPEFLESLEETPAPEVRVGDKVRVTRDFVVGRNDGWRLIVDDLDRTSIVVEGAKVEILERAHVAPKVGDFVDPEARYDTGTVAVLDNNAQSVIVRHAGIWTGNVIGDNSSDYIARDRWKIIYIPEEAK